MAERRSFEIQRLRYCEAMYNLEKERRELIEKRAQFYFGLLALFFGVVAFNEGTEILLSVPSNGGPAVSIILKGFILLFGVALVIALIAIGLVIAPQSREKPFPRKPVTRLFSGEWLTVDTGESVSDELESSFVEEIARRYAVAVEQNSQQSNKKAVILVIATVSTLTTILAYGCILILVLVAKI